jgi:hypothetical protein
VIETLEYRLGEALYKELERLDPSDAKPYAELAVGDRDVFRHAIMAVLERDSDLVMDALAMIRADRLRFKYANEP